MVGMVPNDVPTGERRSKLSPQVVQLQIPVLQNEHTLVQITGGVYDRLVFRVTMLVHVGTEDIHPTEEFSFKLQFKYVGSFWGLVLA